MARVDLEIGVGEGLASMEGYRGPQQVVELPANEYCELEAFIRRTGLLKSVAAGRSMYLVDRKPPRMSKPRARMLERIAMGLGAAVHSDACDGWYGLPPGFQPANPGPGIGNWKADVLVVGDGPSPKAPAGTPNWPFVSSNEYGCAYWLAEQLEQARIPERALYWVNAYGRPDELGDRVPTPDAALLSRPWKHVVTLGRGAASWADDAGFENVIAAHHPSFWWRSRAPRPYPLIETLQKCLRCL